MLQTPDRLVSMQECRQTLETTFGLESFRPGQWEAVSALLSGKDTMVVMPTGGGKSLIYQLPAVMSETGLTIVISPLIALMKDQTDILRSRGVAAAYCNSTQDELEQMRVISHAVTGKIRLLYVSPERAVSFDFLAMLPRMPVNLIAVDEAHCISQWGHDFRTDYRELHKLRARLPNRKIPVAALTATATDRVKKDIVRALDLREPALVQQSFYRPNLRYRIEYASTDAEKESRLLELLDQGNFKNFRSGRCIIYCATRAKVDHLYEFLRQKGFKVGRYHAGKSTETREKMQDSYAAGKVNVLIATNAFGMGMDQPDVRMVLHYQVPASIEAYYQESGRAGRDGAASDCILFFSKADLVTQSFILGKGSRGASETALLQHVQSYGFSDLCRQTFLCGYFGENVPRCGQCDHCLESGTSGRKEFIQREAQKKKVTEAKAARQFSDEEVDVIHGVLQEFPGKFGKKILAGILRGSRSRDILKYKLDRSRHFASLTHVPEEAIIRFFEDGIQKGQIKIAGSKYPKIYLASAPPHKTSERRGAVAAARSGPSSRSSSAGPSPDTAVMRKLQTFRDNEARRLKWKKYMVIQNVVLARIVREKPRSLSELSGVKGMGTAKIEKFGAQIINILSST